MEFRVLGPLDVRDGGRPLPLGGFRQRLVLGALLLEANREVTTDWLVDAVWGDEPPPAARKTLQAYVSRLRSRLGPGVIEARRTGYILHVPPDRLDAARFERLADEGHRVLATDPSISAGLLRRAMSEWRGLPWGELGDEAAFRPEVQRLCERRLDALHDRIAADLETGHAASLVGELEGLVAAHPYREGFHAQLMLALYRSNRQAEALRAFQAARRALGDELGIEPSPMLQELEERILLHDAALAPSHPSADIEDWTLARNPYKGLRAFRRDESSDFFGRSDLVADLIERVEREQFVALVGASGSGKSSVVMAGLLPRLSPERWIVASVAPGADPLDNVRSALTDAAPAACPASAEWRGDDLDLLRAVDRMAAGDDRRLLLVIDQFEELIHQVENEPVRSRFAQNLVAALDDPSAPLVVVVTVRADFLDRVLDWAPLGRLVGSAMVGVPPLRPHELEAAAARPAERAGVHIEPELLAELVGVMTDQSGALPLFQYVLTQLFDNRTGPVLTRATYRSLGGLTGALSRRAEETYRSLAPQAQAVARQLLMRLVTVGAATDDGRRRVEQAALEALDPGGTMAKDVLDAFDAARLLTFDRSPVTGAPTVEVAHEALLREWPRLREWLNDAREDLRLHNSFGTHVAEWESVDRDPDYLLGGSQLELYEHWGAATDIDLTGPERAFLEASVARRDAERAQETARRDEELRLERRSVRRLRALVAVVSVAALVAAMLVVFAANRNRQAVASQREARARELGNAAVANVESDPDLAILLALEAIDTTRAVDGLVVREAEEALHAAVAAHRLVASTSGRWDVEFRPGGDVVVGGNPVRVIDPATDEVRLELPAPLGERDVESVAVSDDGAMIATGTTGGGWVSLWDGETGEEIVSLGVVGDTVAGLEFSRDGGLLAALGPGPGLLRVWDIHSGALVVDRLDRHVRPIFGPKEDIAFDTDATRVAMTANKEVWILDVATSEWVVYLRGHESLTTSVAFVPGTRTVVTGSTDGTFRLWDVDTGTELAAVDAGIGQVVSLAVSRDGTRLLTGGDRGAVRLWALEPGGARPMLTLPGLRSIVVDVDVDDSGTTGAGIGLNGEVAMWDIGAGGRGEAAAWSAEGPVAFTAGGDRLAVADSPGRRVAIVDTSTWLPEAVLEDVVPYVGAENLGYGGEWGSIEGLAFSPDGSLLAITTHGYLVEPGTVTVWDTSVGQPVHTPAAHAELTADVAFSAAGTRLVAGSCAPPGSPASMWDTATWELVFTASNPVCSRSLDVDADGGLVAAQSQLFDVPNVFVWDTRSGEVVMEVTHRPAWRGSVAFSPNGGRLLTAGGDGTLRIWDAATAGLRVVLEGHTGPVEAAEWSADGTTVVSAGLDGTARLWDAMTGAERLRLAGLDGQPSLSLSPDGRWLATSAGGVAKVWALDVDDLIAIARNRLTRSLTAAECVTYHFDSCPAAP